MTDDKDNEIDVANKAKQIFKIKSQYPLKKGYLIRRRADEE